MNSSSAQTWQRILHPKSVAIFGVSPTKMTTFANMYLQANIHSKYDGALYPVGVKGGEVWGRRIYRGLDEVPGPVDLACVAVPASNVMDVLNDCLRKGVPGAQVLTSGFSEMGTAEGKRIEAEIVAFGEKGLRILGPNCFGVHDPESGLTLMPGAGFLKKPGTVAFISQSGGQATDMGYSSIGLGFGWRRIVSIGNACDIDATELMDVFAADAGCKVISAYLEGARDGRAFFEAVKRATRLKPVVIWKAGLTESGSRAVSSHTGSMGGSSEIWTAALKQAGATMVYGAVELLDAIEAFHFLGEWTGTQLGFVGGGGSMSAAGADAADRHGFTLPRLSKRTIEANRAIIQPVGSSPDNPVDAGNPVIPPQLLGQLMMNTARDESISAILLMQYVHHITFMTRIVLGVPDKPLEELSWHEPLADECRKVRAETGKPIVQVLPPISSEVEKLDVEKAYRLWRKAAHTKGIATYPDLDRALISMAHVGRYWKWRQSVDQA